MLPKRPKNAEALQSPFEIAGLFLCLEFGSEVQTKRATGCANSSFATAVISLRRLDGAGQGAPGHRASRTSVSGDLAKRSEDEAVFSIRDSDCD